MRKRFWVTGECEFTESNGTHTYTEMWTTDDLVAACARFHREVSTGEWDEVDIYDSEKLVVLDMWDIKYGYRG